MSNIKYGLISRTDADILENTIDLICKEFNDSHLNITEIGLFNCETSKGVAEYTARNGRVPNYTGIDNEKDKKILEEVFKPFEPFKIILGDSKEVYHILEDNSQHLIFVDGDHSFAGVIADFFCYAPKVKVGGYMAFHDTGKHIKPFKDFQHGDRDNPDAYISVRKALERIGLFGDVEIVNDYTTYNGWLTQWEKIFDEADPNDEAGGITVFKKMY